MALFDFWLLWMFFGLIYFFFGLDMIRWWEMIDFCRDANVRRRKTNIMTIPLVVDSSSIVMQKGRRKDRLDRQKEGGITEKDIESNQSELELETRQTIFLLSSFAKRRNDRKKRPEKNNTLFHYRRWKESRACSNNGAPLRLRCMSSNDIWLKQREHNDRIAIWVFAGVDTGDMFPDIIGRRRPSERCVLGQRSAIDPPTSRKNSILLFNAPALVLSTWNKSTYSQAIAASRRSLFTFNMILMYASSKSF